MPAVHQAHGGGHFRLATLAPGADVDLTREE
jgi:hypothetical protein